MKTESPSDQPPPKKLPPAEPSTAWWESSEPTPDAAPPTNQSTEVRHPTAEPPNAEQEAEGPAPTEAETPIDGSETPTTPYSILTIEQAVAALAASAETPTPPDGMPAAADELEGTRQLEADSAPALSASRSRQGLAAMAARDIGRVREVNQDSVFAMLTTLPREGGEVAVGLFVVADGMGGHQGGEVASRLAVRTVVHHVLSQLVLPALDERMDEALQPMMIAAVQSANEAIWDAAQVMGTDMGTTCTAVLLVGGSLYLAHVGDSRAYLFEPGGLRQITTDHSTVGRLIQLGQLDPSEAREHPLRNQLYRTVGQQPQVMVDFVYQTVGQGSHLLLCSDGLWGLVNETLMAQALLRSPWPQDACNELIALANLAGGDDNISAVVVTLPLLER
ncbi:MAG: serine/threonine-protein phosphatase [Chloroflexales bacterium]|nr:serine/threonine-protein phosphatase [Chloroflexales bacterium]